MAAQNSEVKETGTTAAAISVEAARDNLGRYVLRAGFGNERIMISYHGEERAALIGLRDLERLQALDAAEVAGGIGKKAARIARTASAR